jgi:dipeptidyl aminopeptidase/acylaminoacyl peptidase
VSHLISLSGTFDARFRYNDFNHPFFDEVSRVANISRLDGPPWRDVERYARNSPMLAVENITAPLMIVHSDLDFVPIQQGEEMFSALRYLGKHVRFVRYWGEGHVLSSPANIADL